MSGRVYMLSGALISRVSILDGNKLYFIAALASALVGLLGIFGEKQIGRFEESKTKKGCAPVMSQPKHWDLSKKENFTVQNCHVAPISALLNSLNSDVTKLL